MASVKQKSFIENLKDYHESAGGISYELSTTEFKLEPESRDEDVTPEEEIRPFNYWGVYGLDEESFFDDSPVVRFNEYRDLELTEEESDGYLTDRIIAACSSHLDKNPITRRYVLCKCDLKNKRLKNIELLYFHHFFQHLNLSGNMIETLEPLGGVPFLIYLDASSNLLTEVLDFKPPYYLTYVNLAHNRIESIGDLSGFWSLKKLDLSHNKISQIEGLIALKYLEVLNMSYNQLTVIENLDNLNITSLNLQKNKIDSFISDDHRGFKTMPKLTYVRLGHNNMTSLKIFKDAASVQSIYIDNNLIEDMIEITYLRNLKLLVYLNMANNPVTYDKNYGAVVLSTARRLNFFDTKAVRTLTKVQAEEIYEPDVHVKSAEVQATMTILTNMQRSKHVGVNCLPCDLRPRPMVVLVSPPGCRVERIIEILPSSTDSYKLAKVKLLSTCESSYYNYVTEDRFQKLAQSGEFVVAFEIFKYNYGLGKYIEEGFREAGEV